MGDADHQVIVAAREIETWVDEALDQVDDGLDRMFTFMDDINERMELIMSEVQSCEKFRLCFVALNILVVPVVLALGVCFGHNDAFDSHGLEHMWLQLIVIFLMFLSGTVGLPLYLYSLWDAYQDSIDREKRSSVPRRSWTANNLANLSYSEEDSNISRETFDSLPFDSSTEHLRDFARTLSAQLIEGIRMELDRRTPNSTSNEEVVEPSRQSRKRLDTRRNVSLPEIKAALKSIESQDQEELRGFEPDHEDSVADHRFQSEHAQMNERRDSNGQRPIQVIIVHSNPELPIEVNSRREEREILIQLSEETYEEMSQDNPQLSTSLTSDPDDCVTNMAEDTADYQDFDETY